MLGFAADFVARGYSSCWGDSPDPANHTTFNARTFLQAPRLPRHVSPRHVSARHVSPHHARTSAPRVTSSTAPSTWQAQLQKAARADEKITKGDKNPKDFILFPSESYVVRRTTKVSPVVVV